MIEFIVVLVIGWAIYVLLPIAMSGLFAKKKP
jgi:hypothetical protein